MCGGGVGVWWRCRCVVEVLVWCGFLSVRLEALVGVEFMSVRMEMWGWRGFECADGDMLV